MSVYLRDPDVTLYCGDAWPILREMSEDSIDAVVTSPPYADARPDIPAVGLDEFADWLEPYLAELLYVTRGSLLLNLGRRFRDGEEHGYLLDVLARAKALGWKHIDTLVWHKPNANGRGGPYLHDKHEYVWWLAKSVDAYRGFDAETRVPYAEGTAARYQRGYQNAAKFHPRELRPREPHPLGARPTSVLAVYTGGEKGLAHPSPMPQELARKLVALSCPLGGTVLDPFAGGGTTGLAARQLRRRAVLIELEERWSAVAAERLQQLSLLAEAT